MPLTPQATSPQDMDLSQRLTDAVSTIRHLKDTFKLPSISFGVVHNGAVILKQCIGYRDLENSLPATPDTIYPISSCTKMFTSAGIGLLVADGKLAWSNRVSQHLPEFNPVRDPRISAEADLIDLMRHSMGYSEPTALYLGPDGCHLQDAGVKGLIPLLNRMRTADKDGQRFNRHWMYANANFSLAGEIIARVSGRPYAEFIHDRILKPLGMDRTVLTKEDVDAQAQDGNVVRQYTVLRDGTHCQLPANHWPFKQTTPELPGSGMGSSLNDMLTWAMAVLAAEAEEEDNSVSPLKQMRRLRRAYWTRPPEDPESNEAAFGMGWMRMTLPTSMVGAYSGNRCTREAPWKLHLQPDNILGRESGSRLMIGHSGGAIGGIATLWTFPETQSAVCALVNGRALGDASDFAAQVLMQALFDLRPRMDLLVWARKEAELAEAFLEEEVLGPWMANRKIEDPERELGVYVGQYVGFGGLFALTISMGEDGLAVTFNHVERARSPLVRFKKDTYSFFTGDLDHWATGFVLRKHYSETLLEFKVDDAGNALGLWWTWNKDEQRAWLGRVDGLC
ncbi:uncharacterized protein DSM5745_03877 [Aspergillus mulundensis]|uniref:Beta-lactamase-related domain-containing protein n=1 Tax=Aspergillus mulundensis TaxID=1810919 RepID=A0A3D8SBK0_9EURO|nr:hypothetical protein DSM5745_03877 [Aspergillus mulundensis]RDW83551.1 hypothetical protein DSM5745_03877 [Aspergillus mulundensis]